MRRRNVPCSPCSGGSSGDCCGLKEKLRILWDRTIGSILRINGISPDGDGDFTIEAGDNILLTERGTGNGIRIDTTGAVSYYSAGDAYVDVDNGDLEISLVNPGASGGVALHDDLALVADAVSDILDGTTTVPKATDATNAQYLGDSTSNVGDDTHPVKIVNGQAVAITSPVTFSPSGSSQFTINTGYSSFTRDGNTVIMSFGGCSCANTSDIPQIAITGVPKAKSTTFGIIHAHYLGYLGWFRILAGDDKIYISTTQGDNTGTITCQFSYIADL